MHKLEAVQTRCLRDSAALACLATGWRKAKSAELFFELVYVFAVTQLSHLFLDHSTVGGALQTLFLLLVVWWAWQYTTWFINWFGPDALPVRLTPH